MITRFRTFALICILFTVVTSLFADNLSDINAAKQGNAEAQCRLANDYFYGNGVEKNYAEAVKWYRKAAEQGNADAQYSLGVCYEFGYGVGKNDVEAVKWYRKAAEQGQADAQCNLGFSFFNGNGVEKNYAEAVKWSRKAAEQGSAVAQHNLGICYYNGFGVEKNYTEAYIWSRKAAEQGNANAQCNLGVLYDKGEGVERNIAEAVKWYSLAAEQGNEDAKQALEQLSSSFESEKTQRSISFYDLAKNTSDLIAQKKKSDITAVAFDVSISKEINENEKKKENMELYYDKLIASESEKQKRMIKDEFETTATFKKRQSEQELKITNLLKEKERLSKEYSKTIANLETKKKNDTPSLVSWDSFSGQFVVDEITLIYNVSSIRYNADAGVFDIVLALDDWGLEYKISKDLTISCESPDHTISYQKSIPNIAEAKKFKEQFKGALVSIPNCHVKRFYEHRCVKAESSYTEKSANWNGIAATALTLGVAYLFGPPDNTVYYGAAPDPAYSWTKEKTVTIPAVYENTLVFEFDSYVENEKAVIQEITSNSDLIKINNQKGKTFLSVFPPMIKEK